MCVYQILGRVNTSLQSNQFLTLGSLQIKANLNPPNIIEAILLNTKHCAIISVDLNCLTTILFVESLKLHTTLCSLLNLFTNKIFFSFFKERLTCFRIKMEFKIVKRDKIKSNAKKKGFECEISRK